jgi:hypothetical protein
MGVCLGDLVDHIGMVLLARLCALSPQTQVQNDLGTVLYRKNHGSFAARLWSKGCYRFLKRCLPVE